MIGNLLQNNFTHIVKTAAIEQFHKNLKISILASFQVSAALILKIQFYDYCRSIEDLLCQNADYLVNSISLRLLHLNQNAQAPNVLKVVLQHSNQNVLPLLTDTVHEVSNAETW